MTSAISASGLNVFFAANSPAGRQSLDAALVNKARADVARSINGGDGKQLQAQNLSVRAQEGTALTTQFDYATAADGSTYITGVTIGSERRVRGGLVENAAAQQQAPAAPRFVPQDSRPVSFADIAQPKTALSPVEELALYAQEAGVGAQVVRQAPSREALITQQYQNQSDLIYTANPLFDAAA